MLAEAEPGLLFQATLFNASAGLIETKSQVKGEILGTNIVPQMDFRAQYLCFKPDLDQIKSLLAFSSFSESLRTYRLSPNLYSDSG